MATTKIWPIKQTISKVVNYAVNPEKTANEEDGIDFSYDDVSNVVSYATQDKKTEQALFVSGINCNVDTAVKSMNYHRKYFNKDKGILAFHGYQSFKPGEISTSDAHEIGKLLAQELWGDRFEVVVATHTDRHHIHNHFVVNSVSYKDGYKFPASKMTYKQMQEVSDRLCKERNLSVVENKKRKSLNHGIYMKEKQGETVVRDFIRRDIDEAICYSRNFTDFIKQMNDRGYKVDTTKKYLKVKPQGKDRWFRCKTLGDNYSEDRIKQRIFCNDRSVNIIKIERHVFLNSSNKPKRTGMQGLYYHYLYLMGIYPKPKPMNNKMHFLLKEDIIQLDSIIEQTNYICKHDINSISQLKERTSYIENQISNLKQTRDAIKDRIKNLPSNEDSLRKELEEIGRELYELRKEKKLCEKIANRSIKISRNCMTITTEEKNCMNKSKYRYKEK